MKNMFAHKAITGTIICIVVIFAAQASFAYDATSDAVVLDEEGKGYGGKTSEKGLKSTPPKTSERGLKSTPPKTNVMPAPTAPVPQAVAGSQEPRPLKDILKLTISIPYCESIPQAVDKLIKARGELNGAISAAGISSYELHYKPGSSELISYFVAGVKNNCCSQQKSFSVQEQQAAGCADNDTVKLCMDKLMKHCIKQHGLSPAKKAELQENDAKLNNIIMKSKQVSDQIKHLLSILP